MDTEYEDAAEDGASADNQLFEDEIVMDGGIAAALKHATMKGFMETTTERATGRTVKDPSLLLAKNYSIEDKKHEYVLAFSHVIQHRVLAVAISVDLAVTLTRNSVREEEAKGTRARYKTSPRRNMFLISR